MRWRTDQIHRLFSSPPFDWTIRRATTLGHWHPIPFLLSSQMAPNYGRPFVSKLWHDIHAVFPTYTCNHSCYTICVRFFATHTCVLSCFVGFLFPSIWPFSYKRAYICAQKKSIYMRYKQACVCGVTESRRIIGTELYRQQKTHSCTMEVKSNFSLNQAWLQWRVNFKQGLVLIHCPHSSGGCWLPDNGFVGIRGLSLERLCTLFHKCWPKQRSIQLEISVRQAKHDL